jgi:hypothetical protein
MSLEQRLAAVLQAEVDKSVMLVREAADKVVKEFEAHAHRIVSGEAVSVLPRTPAVPVTGVPGAQACARCGMWQAPNFRGCTQQKCPFKELVS